MDRTSLAFGDFKKIYFPDTEPSINEFMLYLRNVLKFSEYETDLIQTLNDEMDDINSAKTAEFVAELATLQKSFIEAV